jgi:hypothetical protein
METMMPCDIKVGAILYYVVSRKELVEPMGLEPYHVGSDHKDEMTA